MAPASSDAPLTPGDPKAKVWITDYAWITGLAGLIAVVGTGIWFNVTKALSDGVTLFGFTLTTQRHDSLLLALGIITASMVTTELVRLWRWDPKSFIQIDPDLQNGHYSRFFQRALLNYLLYLGLIALSIWLYHTINEYGFQRDAAYYQPWFRFLDLLWTVYLWGGLPYCLLTRALKYNPDADKRDLTTTFGRALQHLVSYIPLFAQVRPTFQEIDKKNARAYFVKFFFSPLMTVFFCDQFPHLVHNMGYLADGLIAAVQTGAYNAERFGNDFYNISIAFIFSVDVALAWCGYIIASRWVDNQTLSAEPTSLGWVVCLVCYPPFQHVTGVLLSTPSEKAITQVGNVWIIGIFTSMMVMSYLVYMSATLWFGVRFSNLTNRGIIRKGPFSIVRHPAYASKNFAWWCVMFPGVVYNFYMAGWADGLQQFTYHTLALILMTFIYYKRAMTEERHLGADPLYQEYCKQVKYRFIPKVL